MNKRILPPEWNHLSGVQLTWPHKNSDWAYMLPEVEACFLRLATEISKRTHLIIVTPFVEEVKEAIASHLDLSNVTLFGCDTNDTWARDHGAITCYDDGNPVILDFKFNGWGLKFAANADNLITHQMFDANLFNGTYENRLNFVLEGGSIESDGKGTLLTTSECLLSKNRNGEWNKDQIEQYLKEVFNLQQVLWVNHGYLAGDDTDSHIDTLVRMCPNDTLVYVKCDDPTDEHFEALKAMERELESFRTMEGNPYRLIALPMAESIIEEGERLPATYANFLIVNDVLLFPTYNQPINDQRAKEALSEAFPGYEIIGIDCCPLIKQHGSLHCVTMQYPDKAIRIKK